MKDLFKHLSSRLSLGESIRKFCLDEDNEILYAITENLTVKKVELSENLLQVESVEHDLDAIKNGSVTVEKDSILYADYIVETGSIFVALRDGHLLRLAVSSFSPPSIVLFKHESPIVSVKLSPDLELIAFADVNNQILMLSIDGFIMGEANAVTSCSSAHNQVGVGWGSEETQFFGLDGRKPKEQKIQEPVFDEITLTLRKKIESDPSFIKFQASKGANTSLDWRGDGKFLCSFTHIPDLDKHQMKVWNRNLELQYMSGKLIDMENGRSSWMPNGSFICCSQRGNTGLNEILMFEKNGMIRDTRIELPQNLSNLYLSDVSWSMDSKIMTLLARQYFYTEDELHWRSMIMFYTMQNYQYDLKQSLYLDIDQEYQIKWDTIRTNCLHLMSLAGIYQNCFLSFGIHESSRSEIMTISACHGRRYPLEFVIIPPPMSIREESFPSLVHEIVTADSPDFYVICTDGTINRYLGTRRLDTDADDNPIHDCPVHKSACGTFIWPASVYERFHLEHWNLYQHFMLFEKSRFAASKILDLEPDGSRSSCLCIIDLDKLNKEARVTVSKVFNGLEITGIVDWSSQGTFSKLLVMFHDGSYTMFSVRGEFIEAEATIKRESYLTCIRDRNPIGRNYNGSLVSLTDGWLMIGRDAVLSKTCTSFRCVPGYVIFTTLNSLHFFASNHPASESNPWTQPMEAGGTLVSVITRDAKVVLQMPRGNLEVLQPKILLIDMIKKAIDSGEIFGEALRLVRRLRLNANFVVDYAMRRLTDWAPKIGLDQNEDLLILLLTELSDEDTINGRYNEIVKLIDPELLIIETKISSGDKVKVFCDKLVIPECFEKSNILKNIKTGSMKEALAIVSNVKGRDRQASLLSFMTYYCANDKLFAAALGTYDLDTAMMVMNMSNDDPKNYRSVLNRFELIQDEQLRRIEVDIYIKRYEDAFDEAARYMVNAVPGEGKPKFEFKRNTGSIFDGDLASFVNGHRLYKHALRTMIADTFDLTKDHDSRLAYVNEVRHRILLDYGFYLKLKRYYHEACIALYLALEIKWNIEAFKVCVDLCESTEEFGMLLAALKIELKHVPKEDSYSRNLSHMLLKKGNSLGFVILHRDCQQFVDKPKTLPKLDLSNSDREFIRLYEYLDTDNKLDKTEIIDNLTQTLSKTGKELECDRLSIKEKFSRLKLLLIRPRSECLEEHVPFRNTGDDDTMSTITDLSSRSSSTSSTKSSISGHESLNTRVTCKTEQSSRKARRATSKIGSRFEDIGLIVEMKEFIQNHNQTIDDCFKLLMDVLTHCKPSKQLLGLIDKLNLELTECHKVATEMINTLWSSEEDGELFANYSLYKRFQHILTSIDIVNIDSDLKVLVRPVIRELRILDFF